MSETTLGQIKAGTAIAGLDHILAGAFSRGHVFLHEVIGLVFTAVSVVRSCLLRRIFESVR